MPFRRNYSRVPRIYSPRSYQNPFFGRRRKKIRRISLTKKLLALAVIAAIGGFVWALFFNAYFFVDNVIVNGAQRIDEYRIYNIIDQQLQKKRLLFFPQQNIFIFSKRKLKKEILYNFSVNDLRVNKNLPRTLTVSFSEKIPAAIWSEQNRYYYIDADMTVLAEVEGLQVNAAEFIALKNETDQPLIRQSGLSKKVSLAKNYLLFCLALTQKSKEQGIAIANTFDINEPEKTLRLRITDGPAVYFNAESDWENQFEKLTVLLSEKLNPNDLKKLEYIDLRFGDKVYYK